MQQFDDDRERQRLPALTAYRPAEGRAGFGRVLQVRHQAVGGLRRSLRDSR